MQLLAIGVNHSTAAVELREQLAFPPESLVDALNSLLAWLASDAEILSCEMSVKGNVKMPSSPLSSILPASMEALDAPLVGRESEAIILSTCNRTELIVSCGVGEGPILSWLSAFSGLSLDQFADHVYIYRDRDAVRHLIRVASGLDSMVLGEPQIFGQMKSAYAVSQEANAIGAELEPTLQHIFSTAKKVRNDTAIGKNPVSIAYSAVAMSQRIFADLSSVSALLIGAGDTIELVARHLVNAGVKNIVIANRTLEHAHDLARQMGAKAILLAEVPEHLAAFDIVISSTASQLPVLGKGAVEQALKSRKRRPMFMVDIAVPRDVEPQVAELPDVYLYTVDDLRDIIDENVKLREAEVDKASEIIEAGINDFIRSQGSRGVANLVVSYRAATEMLRDKELEKAQQLLRSGKPADQVLESLARALTRKIMHQPSVEMRNAGAQQNTALLNAAKVLLGLTDETKLESESDQAPDSDLENIRDISQ